MSAIDEILQELRGIKFQESSDIRQYPEIPSNLDSLLDIISTTGRLPVDWLDLLPLLKWKTCLVLDYFFRKYGFTGPITETFESRRDDILDLLDMHDEAPFTTQRFVEILQNCTVQYTRTHTLMNGLVKVLSVTTVDS